MMGVQSEIRSICEYWCNYITKCVLLTFLTTRGERRGEGRKPGKQWERTNDIDVPIIKVFYSYLSTLVLIICCCPLKSWMPRWLIGMLFRFGRKSYNTRGAYYFCLLGGLTKNVFHPSHLQRRELILSGWHCDSFRTEELGRRSRITLLLLIKSDLPWKSPLL